MKIITKVLPENHNIFLFGDVHLGSVLFYKGGFERFMNIACSEFDGIPEKHNYLVDHGDQFEAITVDDKRYSPSMYKEKGDIYPNQQKRDVIKLYQPIKHKLITLLYSNHLIKLKFIGNYARELADELGTEYGTWSCKIRYVNNKGKLMYKTYHTHGRKQINSSADDPKRRKVNMELILKRHLKEKFGDCIVMCKGHTHKLIVCEPERELYLGDDGKKTKQHYTSFFEGQNKDYIHPDHRWYVNTGSFLKMYSDEGDISGYAEIGEYDPVELGFAVLKCRDGKVIEVKDIVL